MKPKAGENVLITRFGEHLEIGMSLDGGLADDMGDERRQKTAGPFRGGYRNTFDHVTRDTGASIDRTFFGYDTIVVIHRFETQPIGREKCLDLSPETERTERKPLDIDYFSFCLHLVASFPILPVPPAVEQLRKCNKSL